MDPTSSSPSPSTINQSLKDIKNSLYHHQLKPQDHLDHRSSLNLTISTADKAPHEVMIQTNHQNSALSGTQEACSSHDLGSWSSSLVQHSTPSVDNEDFHSSPVVNLPLIVGAKEKINFHDTIVGNMEIYRQFFSLPPAIKLSMNQMMMFKNNSACRESGISQYENFSDDLTM